MKGRRKNRNEQESRREGQIPWLGHWISLSGKGMNKHQGQLAESNNWAREGTSMKEKDDGKHSKKTSAQIL